MKKLTLLALQLLLVAGVVYAQNISKKVETYKFAYINFHFFDDKDKGIIQYTKALNQVDNMCCFDAPCPKEAWIKREKVIMEPIKNHIENLITEIENKNELKILRIKDIQRTGSIIAINENFNLTQKFISFYNTQANKQKTDVNFTVPKSKIGVIDTRMFFDNLNGIKSFAKFKENNNSEYICGKTNLCQELGRTMQEFAEKNGFGIILDSSKELPLELKDLKTFDITKEFISEYNSNK